MMKKHIYKFLGLMLALLAGSMMANNIAISNLSLTGKNTTGPVLSDEGNYGNIFRRWYRGSVNITILL